MSENKTNKRLSDVPFSVLDLSPIVAGGSPAGSLRNTATVKEKLQSFLDDTQADEVMVIAHMSDHKARLHSYEIVADIVKAQGAKETEVSMQQ
ncbi:hypothetical protein ACLBWT_12015 [Paenibacillus sp. D51F]